MSQTKRYTMEIRLQEGVAFSLPLAGPVSRCLAFLIDLFLISAFSTAFERLLKPLRSVQQDFAVALIILFYFGCWLLYGILSEYYWNGQTIGKWLLSVRVVDATGLELQMYQVAIRNVVRTVDLFPMLGLTAAITMLFNRRLQRLGDLAAGTVVIRNRRPMAPNVEPLVRGRYNSLLQHSVVCARLRHLVTPAAGAIAVDALMRRDALKDRARVGIFDELETYFRSLVEFPEQDTEQLSSEQYVRNVVEVLYSTAKKRVKPPRAPATSLSVR